MIFPAQCQPPALQSSYTVSSTSLIQSAARHWAGTSGGLLLSFWMQPRGSGWWEGRRVCPHTPLSVQLGKQDLSCFSGFTDVACGSQSTAALPPFTSSHMNPQTLTGALSFPDVQMWDNFPNIQTKGLYLGKHFEPPAPKHRVRGWIRQRIAFQRETVVWNRVSIETPN